MPNKQRRKEALRILAFAREAGGAAAIAPVLKELAMQEQVLVLAKDYAHAVFQAQGLRTVEFFRFAKPLLEELSHEHLGRQHPDVLLTSAASLPTLDMTERYLWAWAKELHLPSLAVLDQWQNYALRFSGPRPEERLHYLPDRIAVMDEHAQAGMLAEGIPAELIVVTGQPAFDRLTNIRWTYRPEDRENLRRAIGVGSQAKLLCFVAEAFADHFGDRLGYTEQSVLREVISICQQLGTQQGEQIHVAVKLHPQNSPQDFNWLKDLTLQPNIRVTLHANEWPAVHWAMASDLVVGMSSILLVESVLLGRPTVSFQPGARQDNWLIATVLGAIPLLKTRGACLATIRRLLQDGEFRANYLRQQEQLSTDGYATRRVQELLVSLPQEGIIQA